MPEFDPEYLAAIEREQQRLIAEELARLRAPANAAALRHGDALRVLRAAVKVIEHERAEREAAGVIAV